VLQPNENHMLDGASESRSPTGMGTFGANVPIHKFHPFKSIGILAAVPTYAYGKVCVAAALRAVATIIIATGQRRYFLSS